MPRRVIGVLRQCAVARFASHMGMFAGGAGFRFLVMTENASILAGEGRRVLANQVERSRPIVSVLSKRFRDDRAANDQEDSEAGEQNAGRPNQVRGIA